VVVSGLLRLMFSHLHPNTGIKENSFNPSVGNAFMRSPRGFSRYHNF
jgi:hypothetical protein